MNKEDKEILKKCYVMTTDHTLDEENCKLKEANTTNGGIHRKVQLCR